MRLAVTQLAGLSAERAAGTALARAGDRDVNRVRRLAHRSGGHSIGRGVAHPRPQPRVAGLRGPRLDDPQAAAGNGGGDRLGEIARPLRQRVADTEGGREVRQRRAVRRGENPLERAGEPAGSSPAKMPPPSLLTTTRHRSGRGSAGPMASPGASCSSVRSPISANATDPGCCRACASAAPAAVDEVPSMPLAPRLAITRTSSRGGSSRSASRTDSELPHHSSASSGSAATSSRATPGSLSAARRRRRGRRGRRGGRRRPARRRARRRPPRRRPRPPAARPRASGRAARPGPP